MKHILDKLNYYCLASLLPLRYFSYLCVHVTNCAQLLPSLHDQLSALSTLIPIIKPDQMPLMLRPTATSDN